MKDKIYIIIPLIGLSILSSCNRNTTFKCIKDNEFGGIYMDVSISNFNKSFSLGDSLKLEFSNNKVIEDIPYYNGYYGKTDSLVVCSYPNSTNPGIHRCQGKSTYEEFEIKDDTTVKVTLNEKSKYKKIQDSLNLQYSNKLSDYNNDEIRFSNFYVVKSSKLKDNLFYRSCSPCSNKYNRAMYATKQLISNDIDFVLNLSDSEEKYNKYKSSEGFNDRSKYYEDLRKNGKVNFLETGMNFKSDEYAKKVSEGILEFVDRYNNKGEEHVNKCHFHCEEGKDRTGFVSCLILSLANSSKEEMIEDYMKTYFNYYGITKQEHEEKYNIIVDLKIMDFLDYFKELAGVEENYIQIGAKKYLEKGGLSTENINNIITTISK